MGNVHLPQDIPYVQNIVANSTDFAGHWFRFTGKGLKWYGSKEDVSVSWIECAYAASSCTCGTDFSSCSLRPKVVGRQPARKERTRQPTALDHVRD